MWHVVNKVDGYEADYGGPLKRYPEAKALAARLLRDERANPTVLRLEPGVYEYHGPLRDNAREVLYIMNTQGLRKRGFEHTLSVSKPTRTPKKGQRK